MKKAINRAGLTSFAWFSIATAIATIALKSAAYLPQSAQIEIRTRPSK
jgi:hypothetical protein